MYQTLAEKKALHHYSAMLDVKHNNIPYPQIDHKEQFFLGAACGLLLIAAFIFNI